MDHQQPASKKNSLSISKQSNNAHLDNSNILTAIKSIKKLCTLETGSHIQGYLVALGSNQNASAHLVQAREALAALCSQAVWSTEFINPDYTATPDNPKPDYTNQCGYLVFDASDVTANLGVVIKTTKVIEKNIQHDFYAVQKLIKQDVADVIDNIKEPKNRQVIIDIDVLGIKNEQSELIAIAERYPFKNHEWVGINELIQLNYL